MNHATMYFEKDIDFLVSNRVAFDAFVYTPKEMVMEELKRRWENTNLNVGSDVPTALADGFKAVLYVSVITPNQVVKEFVSKANSLGMEILILEQHKDKFSSQNVYKKFLGNMSFFLHVGRNGGKKYKRKKIIDFNISDGKPIPSVTTRWGEPLIDFHHRLFFSAFQNIGRQNTFDLSAWLAQNGTVPKEYYKSLLSLFVRHGVLFENYYLNEQENFFTKEVFLPAFMEVYRRTSHKPLIVSLEPTDAEGDQFWYSHSVDELEIVDGALNRNKGPTDAGYLTSIFTPSNFFMKIKARKIKKCNCHGYLKPQPNSSTAYAFN